MPGLASRLDDLHGALRYIDRMIWPTRWLDYTPMWTAAGGTPSVGNGSLVGRYRKTRYHCDVQIDLDVGSTTNTGGGGGAWKFSLPVAMTSDNDIIGSALAFESGVGWQVGCSLIDQSVSLSLITSSFHGAGVQTKVDTPFVWANGHELWLSCSYPCGVA